MKYSEFKAEVEKLGFFVDMDNAPLYVDKTKGGETLIAIGKHKRFSVDPVWSGFHNLSENEQLAIYKLAHALAITPLAEREEEKRYWLRKIPVPLLDKEGEKKWLWKYTGTAPSNIFGVDTTKIDSELYKTIFTESDLAETPLAEREEEKRYRLRLNIPLIGSKEYLFMSSDKKQVYLGSGEWMGYQTIFTESEIAEMDITGFKKEPVE